MCLLHIEHLTPEGSNWVLALHLWMPGLMLWLAEAGGIGLPLPDRERGTAA